MVTSFATPAIDWIARSRAVRHVEGFRLEPHPEAFYEEEQIPNEYAAALYRRAKVGLNLYRTSMGFRLQRAANRTRRGHRRCERF
ncbi:MAG TPA: hypothetical protein VKE51_25415 [Vicinamibacterales bacterium]|nr:hypothetical protein [Vicinamibacterales bacterium]